MIPYNDTSWQSMEVAYGQPRPDKKVAHVGLQTVGLLRQSVQVLSTFWPLALLVGLPVALVRPPQTTGLPPPRPFPSAAKQVET